jgi:sulfite reductase alpha subunit-like flavoprotein
MFVCLFQYPCNDPAEVKRLARKVRLPAAGLDATFHVENETMGCKVGMPFNTPTTALQLLTEELDISFREPFAPLLRRMAKRAESAKDRDKLGAWVAVLGAQTTPAEKEAMLEMKIFFVDHFLFVADVLKFVPSVTLELADLIELLPRQKPRFYSISSARELRPDEIHLTVGVLEVVTDAGKRRAGLCSSYLAVRASSCAWPFDARLFPLRV